MNSNWLDFNYWILTAGADQPVVLVLGVQQVQFSAEEQILCVFLDCPNEQRLIDRRTWLGCQPVPEVQLVAQAAHHHLGGTRLEQEGRSWVCEIQTGDRTSKENLDELLDDLADLRHLVDCSRVEIEYQAEHDCKILELRERTGQTV